MESRIQQDDPALTLPMHRLSSSCHQHDIPPAIIISAVESAMTLAAENVNHITTA